jgi:hypothetical protein
MRITYLTVFVVTLLTGWVCFGFFSDFDHYVTATAGKGAGMVSKRPVPIEGQITKQSATLEEVCGRAFVMAAMLATLNTFVLWRWQKLRSLRLGASPKTKRPTSEHAA